MTWTKLAPIAKSSGRPMASASIAVTKDGVGKIHVILSASLKDEFGAPTAADVMAGDGDHLGLIRVEFRDDGAFPVKRFVHGGGRITLPLFVGLPDAAVSAAPCVVVEKAAPSSAPLPVGHDPEPEFVVLRLPVDEWRREAAARSAAPKPPSGGSGIKPPPQPPLPAPEGGKVDLVDYLTRKGLKVARLTGGRFMLSGETVMAAELLGRANKLRAEAGLPPLTSAQVR